MNDHEETQDNESLINQEECQELRKRIALSSADFIQLTYNQEKFNARLEQFNKHACLCIEDNKFPQAAVYLDEAEKILQYAAGCGKTIQRALITTVLNNQACLLQHISEFGQSANYLEAIIFNINDFVEGNPAYNLHPNLLNSQSPEYVEMATYFQRKGSLALYHLRFCALTSHSKNNQLALKSAKRALEVLKSLCQEEYAYQLYIQKQKSPHLVSQSKDEGKASSILKPLSRLKDVEDCSNELFESYLATALQYIKQYQLKARQNSQANQQQENSFLMLSRNNFESYSIGNLMQASTKQIEVRPNHQQFMEKEFSKVGKVYRAIHMSMAYFTVATELRLISAAKYSLDEDERKSSQQFKESKIYHLISAILIARFLQCKSVFFDHTIYSFKNHYSMNLQEMAKNYIQVDLLKPVSIIRSSQSKTNSKESINHQQNHQQQDKTIYIHNSIHAQTIDSQNFIKNQQFNPKAKKITQIINKQPEARLIRNIKSKSKKVLAPQSSRVIDTDRIVLANHSRNKENLSRNKLQMRSKDTMRSRKKEIRQQTKINNDDEVRRGIYYGFTDKSRSKSNKKGIIQRKISKKNIHTVQTKSGIVVQNKKGKNQMNIQQQYGVKSAGTFASKLIDGKHKKLKFFKTISGPEENQYSLKTNKSGNDQIQIKKVKSPRNLKKDLSRKKGFSKDRVNN